MPAGKGADMSELQAGSCAVWVSYLQINCYCKKIN